MKKQAGLQYVKDFSFPSECGFTGSAGKSEVKGYMRGGQVKGGGRNSPNRTSKRAKGTTRAAMGGYMGDAPGQQKMGFQGGGGPEVEVDGVKITMPRKKGGRAKMSTHDKLKKHGAEMGFMYGGAVKKRESHGRPENIGVKKYNPRPKTKNTSGQFKQKRGKQATMDSGVQPANRGSTSQEREAGGRGRLKPGFKKGGLAAAADHGKAHGAATKANKRLDRGGHRKYTESKPMGKARGGAVASGAAAGGVGAAMRKGLKKLKGTMSDADRRAYKRKMSPDHTKGKGMSKKGMPKNVKARGGRIHKSGMQGMPQTVKARGGRSC